MIVYKKVLILNAFKPNINTKIYSQYLQSKCLTVNIENA